METTRTIHGSGANNAEILRVYTALINRGIIPTAKHVIAVIYALTCPAGEQRNWSKLKGTAGGTRWVPKTDRVNGINSLVPVVENNIRFTRRKRPIQEESNERSKIKCWLIRFTVQHRYLTQRFEAISFYKTHNVYASTRRYVLIFSI